MEKILIFAGTTEGRELSECLAASGIAHTVCVATEYGELMLKENPFVTTHSGRMDTEEMKELIGGGKFLAVVDATHPYAEIATQNIKAAVEGMEISYFRLKREMGVSNKDRNVTFFGTNEACAKALEEVRGNILLTTGVKELSKYCVSEKVRERLFVRTLPTLESLSLCVKHGINENRVIAMQGPFTAQMNEALIRQYGISCIVTKMSGVSGGYFEKIEAARKTKVPIFVIGLPKEEDGEPFFEVCKKLGEICGKKIEVEIEAENEIEIVLAGIGMGSRESLTIEAWEKIAEADIICGAERMIEPYSPKLEKMPFYTAGQMIPYLNEIRKRYPGKKLKVVILFSGDSGFYSGCKPVYAALCEEIDAGRLKADIKIMPGISSVSALSADIGESYHDAAIVSLHGKDNDSPIGVIRENEKTFLITSGVKDVNRLGEDLLKAEMDDCEMITGYQLSYKEEQIKKMTPSECTKLKKDGLYTCFVKNPNPAYKRMTHGIRDAEFIRGRVPMTKEEIRQVSICKLRLHKNAVVFDIGSGTGSVAVEIAMLSSDVRVYAFERNQEAVSLIRQNMARFRLFNIEVIEKEAPEGFGELVAASHAFIGGSGGKLKEILESLYQMNPYMRVVINAVSMETICEIKEMLGRYPVVNEEIVQIQASRAKKAGKYHFMSAENPVWICSFHFCENQVSREGNNEAQEDYDRGAKKRER